jgi:hypothetical protein
MWDKRDDDDDGSGVEWSGVEWSGVEWSGVEKRKGGCHEGESAAGIFYNIVVNFAKKMGAVLPPC